MKNIDQKLGGTTPLEIILKFKKTVATETKEEDSFLGASNKKDDFLGEDNEKKLNDKYKYWFTRDKIDKIM